MNIRPDTIQQFDLSTLAPNGMRRGFTTGSCATAAVKAALFLLKHNAFPKQVQITLPDRAHFLIVPVSSLKKLSDGSVRADVIKDAGDDPDNTDGATIFAIVKPNYCQELKFIAGPGVGVVTESGIRVPVGEPAINPVPREMIRQAIVEVTEDKCDMGFDVTIGCENGEQIAKRTFNPRLGIKGGISILGTTGIVEPMSLAAYMASVEVYIRVALGDVPSSIAFLPGNIGIKFCREILELPRKRIVNISNFLGFSLACAQQILKEESRQLKTLWVLGHPGKLAKVLDGHWDTHSSKSTMAMKVLSRIADQLGFKHSMSESIENANTVEAVIELLSHDPAGTSIWLEVERQTAQLMHELVPAACSVSVRLFSMNGTALGAALSEINRTRRNNE